MRCVLVTICCALVFTSSLVRAQQPEQKPTTAAEAPNRDTSYINAEGTAHITRVVPVPQDLSPEAQKFISQPRSDVAGEESVDAARKFFETGAPKSRAAWSNDSGSSTVPHQSLASVHVPTPTSETTRSLVPRRRKRMSGCYGRRVAPRSSRSAALTA